VKFGKKKGNVPTLRRKRQSGGKNLLNSDPWAGPTEDKEKFGTRGLQLRENSLHYTLDRELKEKLGKDVRKKKRRRR